MAGRSRQLAPVVSPEYHFSALAAYFHVPDGLYAWPSIAPGRPAQHALRWEFELAGELPKTFMGKVIRRMLVE